MRLRYSIWWLARYKDFMGFVKCLINIKIFLLEKAYSEFEEENWLVKLMFLAHITTHLADLNHCLQGPQQTVPCLFEAWKKFVA